MCLQIDQKIIACSYVLIILAHEKEKEKSGVWQGWGQSQVPELNSDPGSLHSFTPGLAALLFLSILLDRLAVGRNKVALYDCTYEPHRLAIRHDR